LNSKLVWRDAGLSCEEVFDISVR